MDYSVNHHICEGCAEGQSFQLEIDVNNQEIAGKTIDSEIANTLYRAYCPGGMMNRCLIRIEPVMPVLADEQ